MIPEHEDELRKEFLGEDGLEKESNDDKRTFEEAVKYTLDNYNETLKGLKDR